MVRGTSSTTVQGSECKKWLSTPEGWYKAQILLRTLQAPPPIGSLQEWVLILAISREEDIEHAKFRALAQIIMEVNAEKAEEGTKAFEDYMNKAFPGLATRRQRKEDEVKKVLQAWVAEGPLKVTAMAQPGKVRSRMVHRVTEVDKGRSSSIYKKLDKLRM